MRNTSKTISNFFIYLACIAISFVSLMAYSEAADAKKKTDCTKTLIKKKPDSDVMSSVCDMHGNEINLHYSIPHRRIWLSSSRFPHRGITLKRLDKGADPDLIGAKNDIRILFNRTVVLESREFLVVTLAERTARGSGGGQCGAGEEMYLNVYELFKDEALVRNTFLIHSCALLIDLDTGDGSKVVVDESVKLEGDAIQIRWSSYFDYPSPVIGNFSILDNRLVLPSR